MVSINRRQFGGLGLTSLAAAAMPNVAWASSRKLSDSMPKPASVDAFKVLNPELRTPAPFGNGPKMTFSSKTLADIRKHIPQPPAVDPAVPLAQRNVAGLSGAPDVPVYVLNANQQKLRPAILHMHGGGFILGTARQEIARLQKMAKELDCVIVTVEYRLAPETRWEGSLSDNYAALKWLYAQAEELGVDRSRIALMGESAGGGHAALLAQTAVRRGEIPLLFQLLVYPMLDDRTGTKPLPSHIGTFGWDAASNQFGWASFLGHAPGGSSIAGVPGRASSLTGLPPTFIGVGSIDLFAHEDMTYAQRLVEAGVPTELCLVPGGYHGFDFVDAPVSRRFNASKLAALRSAFDERW